ncbi:hypothetical protein CONLIGDRAFT_375993 [Coniochaeta ligniaria NRRL 30616]|uniref:Uncharacterized protein n=1 Tax=Coniochaeta ligniaria NRRL 30616 TaxID=1408157 RepID=A0A1J7JGM8_9PEZI|nr:hypothetical protein CONLIGDRAFT_375993 [Coniochaeta ligniaria NRRL 30616]
MASTNKEGTRRAVHDSQFHSLRIPRAWFTVQLGQRRSWKLPVSSTPLKLDASTTFGIDDSTSVRLTRIIRGTKERCLKYPSRQSCSQSATPLATSQTSTDNQIIKSTLGGFFVPSLVLAPVYLDHRITRKSGAMVID